MADRSTVEKVPPHLRHLIVQQDYERYTAVDQAVWRFVLLQTHARLKATAHAAYGAGLGQTGISVERIPRIADMDRHLAPFGWGAVCVDGFIPPRAFQELQSLSILPIAADMRTAEHLVYTPAPDIIHEAAGHAPILPDPTYAAYLRRIGAAGARAFTLPEDGAVDRAIHALSEIKERASATPRQVEQAEQALQAARAGALRVSEATRLSRLYWWTAEYGLVGKPHDFKLYGAGLLSSLWESFACHAPEVVKPPLTASAGEIDYVVRELPSLRGGEEALAEALAACEVATISLSGGVALCGILSARLTNDGASSLLVVSGGRAELDGCRESAGQIFAVLGDARSSIAGLAPGPVDLTLSNGIRARGRLERIHASPSRGSALLVFASGSLQVGSEFEGELGADRLLVLAEAALGAHAGAPSDFFAETELPQTTVPKPHSIVPREDALLALYELALGAVRSSLGSEVVPVFERVHQQLARHFEHDWLLRWNLLESLQKLGTNVPLMDELRRELEHLELYFDRRQPIASGLNYLARVGAG